jgi:TonB family protein
LQAQDSAPPLPADVDATIRAATSQMNHDLLDNIAKAAEDQRKFDIAQKLLESSLNIRAQQSGEQSVEYGLGLLKLADVERKRGDAGADALYQKAVAVLGNRPEAAPALLSLGKQATIDKHYDQAFDLLQRAQMADPSKAGPALMWMGIVRDRQERPAEAETLYQTAVASADRFSDEAATAMEIYALFLARNNRGDEAKPLQDQAAALRKAQYAMRDAGAAAPEAVSSSALRVGGGVTGPRLLQKVEPAYSDEARAAKYQGTVILYVEVGPDGMAHNMRVQRSLGLELDEKAMEAVSKWQFQPGMKDGQPVTVQAIVEVNFRLL